MMKFDIPFLSDADRAELADIVCAVPEAAEQAFVTFARALKKDPARAFRCADMTEYPLVGQDLRTVDLNGADLRRADLRGARLPALDGTLLGGAFLPDGRIAAEDSTATRLRRLRLLCQAGRFSQVLADSESLLERHLQHEDRATALHAQAVAFLGLDRIEKAAGAAMLALKIYDSVTGMLRRPQHFDPNMGLVFLRIADTKEAQRDLEGAYLSTKEAVRIYRMMMVEDADPPSAEFATALNNLSNRLSARGRREEAVAVAEEALHLCRELAAARPDAFLVDLAVALNTMSDRLSDLGRSEEAEAVAEEAAHLSRTLAANDSVAIPPDLAVMLSSMLNRQSAPSRHEHIPETGDYEAILPKSGSLQGDAVTCISELSEGRVIFSPKLSTSSSQLLSKGMEDALEEAKKYLDEKIFLPRIKSASTPKKAKDVAVATRRLISECRRVGDVVLYINKIHQKKGGGLGFGAINSQVMIEDVYKEFSEQFGRYIDYRWKINDFEPGKRYGGYMLSIFAGIYTPRHGGIYPVGKVGQHTAVVIKARIHGEKYKNQWIEFGERFKYYLKSKSSKAIERGDESGHAGNLFADHQLVRASRDCDEKFSENRAIIDFPDIPVLVFVKESEREKSYTYHGIFRSVGVKTDFDGARWFDLVKVDGTP